MKKISTRSAVAGQPEPQPPHGGSFIREADGSLTLTERTELEPAEQAEQADDNSVGAEGQEA